MINTDQVLSILRQILTFGGGFVVAKGWIDTETMAAAVGAVATLASTAWGIYVHTKTAKIASVNAIPEVKVVPSAGPGLTVTTPPKAL